MEKINQSDEIALNRRKTILRKSVSTIGFASGYTNITLREARSFTGALQELKNNVKNTNNNQLEHSVNSVKCQKCCNTETDIEEINETGLVTKEYFTNQIFLVTDDMLSHGGKKYTLNDIATRWKKDCRTWLWKNRSTRKCHKTLLELYEKLENFKIPSK